MRRTDSRIRLCTAMLIFLLVFIWGNSLMPGQVSQAISNWVQHMLFGTEISAGKIPSGNGILRKAAHFTEFLGLGMTLFWLFSMLRKGWKPALLSGIAVACIDETIQAFVPERAPRLTDVGIDSLGVLTGMLLLMLGHTYWKRRSEI